MEKELLVIDGILNNLAGIQSFYEFEHAQLSTFYSMLKQFQIETLKATELKNSNEIFQRETTKEIKNIEEKLQGLEKKINKIKSDITSRTESKKKLIDLFNALKSVDSLDTLADPVRNPTVNLKKSSKKEHDLDNDLPIMEIREELDDNGEIINSEIKPYNSSGNDFKSLLEAKLKAGSNQVKEMESKKLESKKVESVSKTTPPKPVNNEILEDSDDSKSPNFRPFMIREEIDEDGNIIKSSMSRIPQMAPTEEDIKTGEAGELTNDDEVDEDQLAELFEDMGFKESQHTKVEEVKEEEEINENSNIEQVPLKDNSEPSTNHTNIDTNDLFTLELIADELTQDDQDEDDIEEGNEDFGDMNEYEWPAIDADANEDEDNEEEDEEEDDDDVDEIQKRTLSNMFGSRGQNLFAQQLRNLRSKNETTRDIVENVAVEEVKEINAPPKVEELVHEMVEEKEEIIVKKNKVKKSVSFNSTVDVKNVPDIWDDLRKSNAENEIKTRERELNQSLFKRSVQSKPEITEKSKEKVKKDEEEEVFITDVVEHQVVEKDPISLPQNDVFKTFDSTTIRKQLDNNMANAIDKQKMTKLSGKKGPSRFKIARAAELGKKFQEAHVPSDIRDQLQSIVKDVKPIKKELKSNLKSLQPQSKFASKSKSIQIETPEDINPLPVNPSITDEDYEIIRNEATDDLFDDDDDMNNEEFVSSNVITEPTIISDEDIKNNKIVKDEARENTFFPKYEKKIENTKNKEEVIGTSLDYKSLSEDLETMAKAYVLGLYDDDMHTEGQVIEELKDFESHNKIVEDIEKSKLHDRVEEINKKLDASDGKIEEILNDNNPMVVSDIVENNVDEILQANAIPDDQLDIELSDETLTTQVALDYTRMRSNMIHKYNGGFRETDKEKEFVLPEGSERVSRFKKARLGM